jgi:hypothetical protein
MERQKDYCIIIFVSRDSQRRVGANSQAARQKSGPGSQAEEWARQPGDKRGIWRDDGHSHRRSGRWRHLSPRP